MTMFKHCIDDKDLRMLQMLNFPEVKYAHDMQSLMIKLNMYCFKKLTHREPNESIDSCVAAMRDIIR